MKTTTILGCIVAASLGCSTATQSPSPSPGDDPAASSAVQPAGAAKPGAEARAEHKFVGDPRTGGPIFTGAATLPSPLKEVGR